MFGIPSVFVLEKIHTPNGSKFSNSITGTTHRHSTAGCKQNAEMGSAVVRSWSQQNRWEMPPVLSAVTGRKITDNEWNQALCGQTTRTVLAIWVSAVMTKGCYASLLAQSHAEAAPCRTLWHSAHEGTGLQLLLVAGVRQVHRGKSSPLCQLMRARKVHFSFTLLCPIQLVLAKRVEAEHSEIFGVSCRFVISCSCYRQHSATSHNRAMGWLFPDYCFKCDPDCLSVETSH